MKGTLVKINDQWNVKRGLLHYPVYQHDFDINSKQQIIPFKVGDEVDFVTEKFWETGIEVPFEVAVLLTPPYVSDDFQIGPDGAYEHDEDLLGPEALVFHEKEELDDYYYHEFLDRLTLATDTLERHLMDHPVCSNHEDLKDLVEKAVDCLTDAYLKMQDIRN